MNTLRQYSMILVLGLLFFSACKKTYINKRLIDGTWEINTGSTIITKTLLDDAVIIDTLRHNDSTNTEAGFSYNSTIDPNNLISGTYLYRVFTLNFAKKANSFTIHETNIDTFVGEPFNYFYKRSLPTGDTTITIVGVDTTIEPIFADFFYQRGSLIKQTTRTHSIYRTGTYIIKDDSINNENNNLIICSETTYEDSLDFSYLYFDEDLDSFILTNTANYYYKDGNNMINLETVGKNTDGANNTTTKNLITFTIEIEERNKDFIKVDMTTNESNIYTEYSAHNEKRRWKLVKSGS